MSSRKLITKTLGPRGKWVKKQEWVIKKRKKVHIIKHIISRFTNTQVNINQGNNIPILAYQAHKDIMSCSRATRHIACTMTETRHCDSPTLEWVLL